MHYDSTHETPLCNASPPQCAADFTHITRPGTICHICGALPGVVLAYDIYAQQIGMWFCARDWQIENSPIPASFLVVVEDRRKEQALLEAAAKNSDNLMDLLQEAIETMNEAQASRLLDKVHQVQSENLRDLRGWNEEIDEH